MTVQEPHRMQVLVNGTWIDVSNTVRGFEFDENNVIVDEVQTAFPPMSFEFNAKVEPNTAAQLRAVLDELAKRERIDRARRRLWLCYPYIVGVWRC